MLLFVVQQMNRFVVQRCTTNELICCYCTTNDLLLLLFVVQQMNRFVAIVQQMIHCIVQ
jgi:hypothetical protein